MSCGLATLKPCLWASDPSCPIYRNSGCFFGHGGISAVSGLIAFVGIIVPHTVRLIAGASNRIRVAVLASLWGSVPSNR